MRIVKSFFLFASILSLSNACATLPNVSEMIDEAPVAQEPLQIVSSQGLLSPQKSKAIMERLKQSVNPTDILERHTVVVESITESPLTKGNKVALLADGKAAYAAMFKTMQSAKDHINLESYIIEDDETGRKFADLLLQKQAEGVQVNVIYDSVGSMNTPASFFQRLRDNGIQVVEFNPVNPLKAGAQWALTHRDHRKILIVDGKTATVDGVWSTVGSTNMDYLSLLSNDEVNTIILNHEFAVEMEKMFLGDLAGSRQIQGEEWERRPVFQRIRTWFVHLFFRWL